MCSHSYYTHHTISWWNKTISLNTCFFLSNRKNFVGTQTRVWISHSKRAIGVRAIEVRLYHLLCLQHYCADIVGAKGFLYWNQSILSFFYFSLDEGMDLDVCLCVLVVITPALTWSPVRTDWHDSDVTSFAGNKEPLQKDFRVMTYFTIEDPNRPAHPRSLISIYAVR